MRFRRRRDPLRGRTVADVMAEAGDVVVAMLGDGLSSDEVYRLAHDPAVGQLVLVMVQQGWRDAIEEWAAAVGQEPIDARRFYRETVQFAMLAHLAEQDG